jgi:hypothetical protein
MLLKGFFVFYTVRGTNSCCLTTLGHFMIFTLRFIQKIKGGGGVECAVISTDVKEYARKSTKSKVVYLCCQ